MKKILGFLCALVMMCSVLTTTAFADGYVVSPEACGMLKVTHTNLLDRTIEGVECRFDRVFAVQFDPTAAEGECHDLFKKFVKLMEEGRDA